LTIRKINYLSMKNFLSIAVVVLSFLLLLVPPAFADAPSASIQSLSPGSTVFAKDRITFTITTAGFAAQTYQLSDSFTGSTVSLSDISGAGNFFWLPLETDIGVHTLTITASDFSGNTASVTQSVTVVAVPSLSIQSVSPGTTIMPGTPFSFTVTASGFTTHPYSVSDLFNGSSVNSSNIDASGNFSWTPDMAQDGDHTITVYTTDSLGHSASVNQSVHVGAGPGLRVILVSPGVSVPVGTTTSFLVTPSNFAPTSFAVSDSFTGSTVSNNNITTSGQFSWQPQPSDVGVHVFAITGVVGTFGQSATTSQTITVLGQTPAQQGTMPTSPAPTPTPVTTSSLTFSFTTYLHPGMQGDDVMHLQSVLSQLGFFSGTATGYYGAVTTNAVVKFQAAHGLTQLGVVGPATRAALNALQPKTSLSNPAATSSMGDGYLFNNFMGVGEDSSDGSDVLELQKRLALLGFYSAAQTGSFDTLTEQAVKQFQTAHSITATGYVGALTRAALNK
jgi:peptidoglycan hydrolase-like protein with peptidoglycan-binding domain